MANRFFTKLPLFTNKHALFAPRRKDERRLRRKYEERGPFKETSYLNIIDGRNLEKYYALRNSITYVLYKNETVVKTLEYGKTWLHWD